MERQFKGIWVPAEIWEDTNLTWNEKVVLMEIDSFTAAGKDCFISDSYIGNLIGVTERTARRILSKLINQGYVKKTCFDGRTRYIESTITDRIVRAEWTKMSGQTGHECPDTINNITNTNLQEKEKIYKKERFEKPTVSEVKAYCEERRNNIDPQAFVDFYDSKGWKVGNTPMRDWKAAVRTWEAKRKNEPPTPTPSPKQEKKESLVEYYRRIIKEINEENDDRSIDEQ